MLFKVEDEWTCVAIISSSNRLHLNRDAVPGIKLSDNEINSCRRACNTDYYNFKVLAHDFDGVKNQWLDYPHVMYLTKDYEFNAIEPASNIEYSNRISLDIESDPIDIFQKPVSLSFGCGDCGDTFFSYGSTDPNYNGLFQSFSGSGDGSIWIR